MSFAHVRAHLHERAEAALAAGIAPENIVPGCGRLRLKGSEENLELLRRLRELTDLGYPLLLGPSRKSTIGAVLGGLPPSERIEGTAAAVALAIANGAAIVRVHDVLQMSRVARMTDAVVEDEGRKGHYPQMTQMTQMTQIERCVKTLCWGVQQTT